MSCNVSYLLLVSYTQIESYDYFLLFIMRLKMMVLYCWNTKKVSDTWCWLVNICWVKEWLNVWMHTNKMFLLNQPSWSSPYFTHYPLTLGFTIEHSANAQTMVAVRLRYGWQEWLRHSKCSSKGWYKQQALEALQQILDLSEFISSYTK